MTVIFVVVYTKGLRGFSGIAIGGIVGLDIFLLAFISGASMNPARSLSSCSCLWSLKQFMALLVGHIHWHINSCLNV